MEDNVTKLQIDVVKEKFNSLIDKLTLKEQEKIRTKKMYIGIKNYDGTIWEFYIDKEGSIMQCISDSTIIEEHDLNGIFNVIETQEAFYITASQRNQLRGISCVGSIKKVPKVNEMLEGCVYTVEENVPKVTEVSFGKVKSITKIMDNIYIIYNGQHFVAVSNGYNLDKNPVVNYEQEQDYVPDASYC